MTPRYFRDTDWPRTRAIIEAFGGPKETLIAMGVGACMWAGIIWVVWRVAQ